MSTTTPESPGTETPPENPATETPPAQETDWKAEARKWEQRAKENSSAAEKLAAIEEASKTELEKANDRAAAAEAALAAKEAEALRLTIASKHGITGDHLDLLVGTDEAELEAKAVKVAALIAQTAGPSTGPYVPSEGTAPSGALGSTADQFAAALGPILS